MTILFQIFIMCLAAYCIFMGGLEAFMSDRAKSVERKYAISGIILLIAGFAVPYVTGAV